MSEPRRALLDTCVVINFEGVDLTALPFDQVAVSAVTMAELAAGVNAAQTGPERAARLRVLQWAESTFQPLPFDTSAARQYGQIYALVRARGRQPRARLADLFIASVAAAHGLPLVTSNTADFAGLDEVLEVVSV